MGDHSQARARLSFKYCAGQSCLTPTYSRADARAGLGWLHFHDLRHTFASHWMMNGGDLYVLKDILGHKSVSMTQRYAHLSPEYKRAAVNRMDNMWKSAPSIVSTAREAVPKGSPVTVLAHAAPRGPEGPLAPARDAVSIAAA